MKTASRIYISESKISNILENKGDKKRIEEIFNKALELKGLDLEESAILLNIQDDETLEQLFRIARQLKESIYGSRIVLFAPLYVSNYCTNNCLYCGFRLDNKDIERKKLSVDEAAHEAEAILNMGHKRILLVAGEDDSFQVTKKLFNWSIINTVTFS